MKQEAIPIWENDGPDICRFCAFAKRRDGEETVFCEKKKKELAEDETCKKFRYDILKKDVRRRKQPQGKRMPFEL